MPKKSLGQSEPGRFMVQGVTKESETTLATLNNNNKTPSLRHSYCVCVASLAISSKDWEAELTSDLCFQWLTSHQLSKSPPQKPVYSPLTWLSASRLTLPYPFKSEIPKSELQCCPQSGLKLFLTFASQSLYSKQLTEMGQSTRVYVPFSMGEQGIYKDRFGRFLGEPQQVQGWDYQLWIKVLSDLTGHHNYSCLRLHPR